MRTRILVLGKRVG
ncbi:Hypothetical protein SLIV_10947 [Streptomyces lividans TK24]|uniref:Leader peptide n=3 Tax=Streptomyces TaxID=1883 RepID=Q53693_STRAX|nr:leader peptide [Streptomyces avermitilis]AAV52902.1 putative leader peptide [Streptomyces virginiae]QNR95593.1 Hypothetical protein SLIV_10947 [Streptomyces lividans TK24]QSJ08705.1 Hypothetical protein SLIVDG2_10947 [Streptomyces lividans]CAI4174079.1 Leader peptide [Streptomyces albidoflavus]